MITILKLTKEEQKFITKSLKNGEKIRIFGLGIFKVNKNRGRTLYHNLSNKVITIKPYNKIHFTPSLTLKAKIK